ncbi:MAG: insulinase family protein [Muribaculaceae bacterium]|nr:insulinase family protein [Muribaculaceae bacterium]
MANTKIQAPEVHEMGELRMPKPETEVLPNGAVLSVIDGGSQEINDFSIVFAGGQAEASSPAEAKVMASVMPEGAGGLSGAEVSEALDFRGARLNVYCGRHHTVFDVASLNSMVDGVFDIGRRILLDPAFDANVVENMRERAANDLALQQSKVENISRIALNPLIMGPSHPEAQPETPEQALSVVPDALCRLHERIVRAKGCHAFLSGRVPESVRREARELLMSLPSGDGCPLSVYPYEPEPPQRVDVAKAGALQSSVRCALPAPARSNPDYVPLRMTVKALGGYFGSRLMKNIREDKGYTYGISAYLLGAIDGSYISISAQADEAYVDALIEEVRKELSLMGSEPIGSDELRRHKQHIASELMQMIDDPFAVNDYYRTQAILGLADGYYERQVEVASALSPELIMEMAARYFHADSLRIAVAGA